MTSHFLQSKEWEEFQKDLGRTVWRTYHGSLIVKIPLVFGASYLYSAGLPEGKNYAAVVTDVLTDAIQIAKRERIVFLKLELMLEKIEYTNFIEHLEGWGLHRVRKEVQPQTTIILDLTKREDELLKTMHQKTRYNIRVAENKEFRIKNYELRETSSVFEKFWELLKKTAQRDDFSSHAKEYYEKLLDLPIAKLFTAECQEEVIAANIILFYGDTAYYLHGASDYAYRSLMAPYLLHWETIKYAKERGCKSYDFWGIDEQKWPGVTRFKRGFGGREVHYVGSFDYIFQPLWYGLYNLRHKIKGIF